MYSNQNLFSSFFNLRKKLFQIYSKINKKGNNYQDIIHSNYFKEIQLIFILLFIFKFDLISKNTLNTNVNNSNVLNIYSKNKIYIEKEFWQLNNNNNYQPLAQLYLNNINNEIYNKIDNKTKNIELENIRNINFFYQLSNIHSFLISNLTIIILLFVLKPSILLSSTRLLSLSLFTY
jgi:hypothetical protein